MKVNAKAYPKFREIMLSLVDECDHIIAQTPSDLQDAALEKVFKERGLIE